MSLPSPITEINTIFSLIRNIWFFIGCCASGSSPENLKTYSSQDELLNDFFSEKITYGQLVEIPGFLSELSHSYLPVSYLHTAPGPCKVEEIAKTEIPGVFEETNSFTYHPVQIPVSIVPKGQSSKRIYFLYPSDFNGFLYKDIRYTNECQKRLRRIPFEIPNSNKPIPILASDELLSGKLEKQVILRGVISKPPEKPISEIILGETGFIFEKIYKGQGLHNSSLAISIDESACRVIPDEKRIFPQNNTTLFFEFALYIPDKTVSPMTVLNKALPFARGIREANIQGLEEFHQFLIMGDIRIIGRSPNYFAIFLEKQPMQPMRKILKRVLAFFATVKENIRKIIPRTSHKIIPTFLTNMDWQYSFFDNGIFSDPEISKEFRDYVDEINQLNPKIKVMA